MTLCTFPSPPFGVWRPGEIAQHPGQNLSAHPCSPIAREAELKRSLVLFGQPVQAVSSVSRERPFLNKQGGELLETIPHTDYGPPYTCPQTTKEFRSFNSRISSRCSKALSHLLCCENMMWFFNFHQLCIKVQCAYMILLFIFLVAHCSGCVLLDLRVQIRLSRTLWLSWMAFECFCHLLGNSAPSLFQHRQCEALLT